MSSTPRWVVPILFASAATALGWAASCTSDEAGTGSGGSGASTLSGTGGGQAGSSAGGAGGAGGQGVGGGGAVQGGSSAGGAGGGAQGGGGAGQAGSAQGGSAGSGGAGGHGVGGPCTASVADCDPGLYCQAQACGAGTCQETLPPAQVPPDRSPVCGCDGVTYWNAGVAAFRGAPVSHAGACTSAEDVPCSPQQPCAAGASCNRQVADQPSCAGAATGVCWSLPVQCALGGPEAYGCLGQPVCFSECNLIQSGNPWYDSPSCP